MPKVSVITPTYNRADMLGEAIQSVLDQDYTDWELIVVDDGSRDNTKEVVSEFADPRIRYIYQENKGLPGARNTGIRHAQGEYVAFLDSDDLFLPHKLVAETAILDEKPDLGLAACGYFEVDRELRVIREVQPWQAYPELTLSTWLLGCPLVVSTVLVRRSYIEKVGLFDENLRYEEDWDLWLRLSHSGCTMEWIKRPVCCYRIHGNTMTRHVQQMKAGMLAVFEKFYAQPNLPAEAIALRNDVYANVYLNASARAYATENLDDAKESLAQALRLNPALLAGNPPRVLDSLASFALTPQVADAKAYMERALNNLPEGIDLPRYTSRKVRGLLHAVAAFEHHGRQEQVAAARDALAALFNDPGWARNRGLLSLIRQSLVR